jgi:hypothetical protein
LLRANQHLPLRLKKPKRTTIVALPIQEVEPVKQTVPQHHNWKTFKSVFQLTKQATKLRRKSALRTMVVDGESYHYDEIARILNRPIGNELTIIVSLEEE